MVGGAGPAAPAWPDDGSGEMMSPPPAFFSELVACGRPATTLCPYGMDLLRWFRSLSGLGLACQTCGTQRAPAQQDVVSVHMVLSEQTRGLIGRRSSHS